MFDANQLKKDPSFNLSINPFSDKDIPPSNEPLPAGISLEDAAHQISLERRRKRFNLAANASEDEVKKATHLHFIERFYGDEIRQRNGGVLPPPALSE